MEMEYLVSKANFAKLAGVNPATITTNTRKNGCLFQAMVGKRMNALHEIAIIYLNEKGQGDVVENLRNKSMIMIPGFGCGRLDQEKAKIDAKAQEQEEIAGAPTNILDESKLPEDVREFGHMTLKEIIEAFGTDIRFQDWLKNSSLMESLYEKRLKNKLVEKSLIPRQFVAKHLFNAVEQINVRMLSDAPRTIASRVMAEVEAGEPVEKIEETIRKIISSQIKGLKRKMERGIEKG